MTTRSILFLLLLLAYCLPVFYNSNASLNMSAYDLAEWITLIPSQRSANPALLLSFALRIHLVLLCLLISLSNHKYYVIVFLVTVLVIAQLPPLEILTTPTDVNYQQQLVLSAFSVLTLTTRRFSVDYRKDIELIVSGAGIILWIVAGVNTFEIYGDYMLQAPISLTVVSVPLLYIALLANTLFNQKREPDRTPVSSITA